jgi:hypothetical protein
MNRNDLNEIIDNLDLISSDYRNLASELMKPDSKVMKVDLIALSIINRAISINNAFRMLIKENNTFAALHFIRIQIDNLIRYHSILVAEDPNYVDYVLEGKPINQFKDLNGKSFKDKYLVTKMETEFKGITKLYEKYCNHIHYGKEHLERIKTISENENAKYRIEIGNFDRYTLEEQVVFITDMITVSLEIFEIINKWVIAKEGNS